MKVEEAAPVLHTEPETEPAPEGVPVITLQRQYEQESREIRTDVEAPREMNGQTVFFDEDHHPIMDSTIETEATEQLLFCPRRV